MLSESCQRACESKFLLAEDNDMLARGAVKTLADDGPGADWIGDGDGDAAADFLRTGDVDVAIIDVNLPGLSGPEIVRAMRAGRNDTPVLMLAARGEWQPPPG